MIDPFTSLAFNLYSLKGRYALLLGSGISSAAGIPTGWQIVLDLIRKITATRGVDCGEQPDVWYSSEYHEPPNYSKLMKMLGKTPSERKEILRRYIEPTVEEREQNKKVPTVAHHAIAELVKGNFIKVIVTTNFDRLIETALNQIAVSFNVVSTTDDIRGLEPLHHQNCLLVKVNGDYLDTRIKNTEEELLKYDRLFKKYLDSILSDFGLIICGWSGQYDVALADAIKRNNNRRYGMYWTHRGDLKPEAEEIILKLNTDKLQITDADQFFQELKEKIYVIEKVDIHHPLSSQVAIARLKKYISENNKIEIYDLFKNEWNDVHKKIIVDEISNETWDNEQKYNEYLSKSISRIEILQKLLVNLLKWNDGSNSDIINPLLKILLNIEVDDERHSIIPYLKLYPAITIFYTIGVMLFYKKDYSSLSDIFRDTALENFKKKLVLALKYLNETESQIPDPRLDPLSPPREKQYNYYRFMCGQKEYPSDYIKIIYESIRESAKDFIFDKNEFEILFIRFEYFLRLYLLKKYNFFQEGFLYISERDEVSKGHPRLIMPEIFKVIKDEVDKEGNIFEWIKSGFFNNRQELIDIQNKYDSLFHRKYSLILLGSS